MQQGQRLLKLASPVADGDRPPDRIGAGRRLIGLSKSVSLLADISAAQLYAIVIQHEKGSGHGNFDP
jgi:hypothetical protein